jgi:hypothetical protein
MEEGWGNTYYRRIPSLSIIPNLAITMNTASTMAVNANMVACYNKPRSVVLELNMI